ncbi:YheC/YheD family endospore coat-associated protein [Mesobacillus foraminis]|jgi:hypothetical protein|uniref:YheC/YheD family endospore coat-associated protein n=1 Tax=Mesobacillus foraminis TaxID=279826 RepID=UPI000EF4BB52|nr:YheC/YheD family protein [Mesobacillus foraminis]
MRKKYRIEINSQMKNTILIPADLGSTQPVKVAFGNKMVEVACVPHTKQKIVISKDIQAELLLPDPELYGSLHAFIDSQTLFIGPLIGILTSGFTSFPLNPVGKRTTFFAKLLSVNKIVGALSFLFGEEHIDWEKGMIKGQFLMGSSWTTISVPFPNVVYDRIPNRRSEKRAAFKILKERMQTDYLIPWYNPGFFSKMEIFERLQQDDYACSFLPETHPFTSFSVMERMLADYGQIYIKPSNGSLGLGVHQIIYDRLQGHYYCRYRESAGENRLRRFTSLEVLMKHVFHKKNLAAMVVQQGIQLLRADGRLVDFRVHTNKDENGEWQVAAIAGKVAGHGSPTTHIHNGGEVKTIEEIFEHPEEQQQYRKELSETALYLSKILEHQVEGFIGEIGFDLGIDKEGRVWLFEANSKPGRSIFKHPALRDFDLLTRKLSLAYGVYLTEKAITTPEEIFK